MTDNEIIKAIEWWITVVNNVGSVTISKNDMLAVYDFINRQKAEIERFEQIETTINEFWSKLQKLSIAKGKETPTLEELLEYIEQVKAEAIKEFADKLKGLLALNGRVSNEDYYYMTIYIDNLVKEWVVRFND